MFAERALFDALERGRDDVVLAAVQQGLDPNSTMKGSSLLSLACVHQRPALVRGLIAMGADPNGTSQESFSPLIWSINHESTTLAALLLDQGANLERIDRDYERSPLWHAAAKCGTAMIELLLARGAQVNARDRDGNYPIHGAVIYENPPGAQCLASRMETVDVRNADGETPLRLALALIPESDEDGPLGDVTELLRACGADPDAQIVPDLAFCRARHQQIIARMKAAAPGWEPSEEQLEESFRSLYPHLA